jgi:hydrogenase maturation protein HypF
VDGNGVGVGGEDGDAIGGAAALLLRGKILAIKGLGGWHLACDATNAESVAELRRRKRRDEKPFAVMVRDMAAAARLVELGDAERELLASPAHPIVIMPRRGGAREVVAAVAPESGRLGLMLPYTPLHHVLLGDVGGPLVMTSGNLSDEPIACDDDDAFERLALVADAFLAHDRVIASRADDSVAIVARGRPVVTRRSRGFVPGRIGLARPLARPTLACGAQLKNTFCLGAGDAAYFGPHIGDLDNVAAYEGYEKAIERLEGFVRIRPEVVAHDMHPDYLSTRYALGRHEVTRVAVQHHHAHVASTGSRGPSSAWPSTAPASARTARRGEARSSSPISPASSASRRSARCASPAATGRSSSRGASRSRSSTTRSTATRRSIASPCSTTSRGARSWLSVA